MTERELISLWHTARWHLITSQLAPTLLLAATVGLLAAGLGAADVPTKLAVTGILLASGLLGAAVQFTAATEGLAVANDLADLGTVGRPAARIIAFRPGIRLVRIAAPGIFVLVYLAILWQLFLP